MDIKDNQETSKGLPNEKHHKIYLGTYILLAISCLIIYLLLRANIFNVQQGYQSLLLKISLASCISFCTLALSSWIERITKKKGHNLAARYNMVRLIRLLTFFAILLIIISFVNKNWYAAAVSLGFFSLILGFALQNPISSLLGWIYIILRSPYKVGDRIQVDTFTGDVVEIGYLDTTLWEFGGAYMTSDIPSGRLIRFPNSLLLDSPVFNYSWKKFPYIWNEIPFHVAYESDFGYVESTIKRIAKKELGESMAENVQLMKEYLKDTPVDEIELKEYPFVNFRTNANTWVEVLLVYLVPPKRASAIRSTLIKNIVTELLKEPGKVMFPISNSR